MGKRARMGTKKKSKFNRLLLIGYKSSKLYRILHQLNHVLLKIKTDIKWKDSLPEGSFPVV